MILVSIITKLNEKEESLRFDSVTLTVIKHDGHKTRYKWIEESSEIEDSLTSGECIPKKQGKITGNGGDTPVTDEVRK